MPDRPSTATRGGTATSVRTEPRFRWRAVAQPGLVRLLVLAGVLGLLTVGDGFIYLALLDRGGFAAHWFPLMYVGTNIAYLALAIPIGRLADRVGRAKVLIWGHGALLGSYTAVAISWNIAASTVVALLLLGTFYAATDGVIAALASRLVPSTVRASGIASAQTVVAVARMLSSAGFGILWFAIGPQHALYVVGCALLVILPLATTTVRRLDRTAEVAR